MLVNANKMKPYYLFDDNTKGFVIKFTGEEGRDGKLE
jgi:hypothetical protein